MTGWFSNDIHIDRVFIGQQQRHETSILNKINVCFHISQKYHDTIGLDSFKCVNCWLNKYLYIFCLFPTFCSASSGYILNPRLPTGWWSVDVSSQQRCSWGEYSENAAGSCKSQEICSCRLNSFLKWFSQLYFSYFTEFQILHVPIHFRPSHVVPGVQTFSFPFQQCSLNGGTSFSTLMWRLTSNHLIR